MVKAWALVWYGVDETEVSGIVTDPALIEEWKSRDLYNDAVEFTVNEIPKRSEPVPLPAEGTLQRTMIDYYSAKSLQMLREINGI